MPNAVLIKMCKIERGERKRDANDVIYVWQCTFADKEMKCVVGLRTNYFRTIKVQVNF